MSTFKLKGGPSVQVRIETDGQKILRTELSLSDTFEVRTFLAARDLELKIMQWMREYASRSEPSAVLPVSIEHCPPFTQKALEELQRIPFGEIRSYGQLFGTPSSRAVGAACARNPIPLIIPCHRVLNQGGGLGGFSQGLEIKKRLLAFEGRKID